MSPSPPRVLPLVLQVEHLRRIFSKLNPDLDPQRIDWDITGKGPLDPTAPYSENHQNMENAYPQYKWFETSKDRAETKEQAIEEYADFLDYLLGLAVIPEAREEMKPVLEKALSDYKYRTERDIEKTTLRKTVKKLEEQLLEAKRTGKTQTEIIKKEIPKIKKETERPKIPKPRLLPPPPETCPIEGTHLSLLTRIPVKGPVRLTEEEESFRQAMHLPTLTEEITWIDVPPTLKVWVCEAPTPHYFERSADGRLIQRTQEYLYKKILREAAKLRKITAPLPTLPSIGLPPTHRPTPPVVLSFQRWLRQIKNMYFTEYAKLSEEGRKNMRDEYEKWVSNNIRGLFK